MANVTETLLSVEDLSRITQRSGHWIRRQIHAGKLPAVRLGIRLLVKPSDLADYLVKNAATTGPNPRRDPRGKADDRRRNGRPKLQTLLP